MSNHQNQCIQCGAPLLIHENQDVVVCQFCGATNQLKSYKSSELEHLAKEQEDIKNWNAILDNSITKIKHWQEKLNRLEHPSSPPTEPSMPVVKKNGCGCAALWGVIILVCLSLVLSFLPAEIQVNHIPLFYAIFCAIIGSPFWLYQFYKKMRIRMKYDKEYKAYLVEKNIYDQNLNEWQKTKTFYEQELEDAKRLQEENQQKIERYFQDKQL
jgi:hypothetical protein